MDYLRGEDGAPVRNTALDRVRLIGLQLCDCIACVNSLCVCSLWLSGLQLESYSYRAIKSALLA